MILPNFDPIQPGEDLFGYILRRTTMNKWPGMLRILRHIGFGNHLPNLVRLRDKLEVLSEILEIAPDELAQATFFSHGHRGHCWGSGFGGQRLHGKHILYPRVRVCGDCLRDFGFIRKSWQLALFTDCPIHGTPLICACPKCGQELTWRRHSLYRCQSPNCWFDLRESRPPSSDSRAVWLAAEIERRVLGQAPQIFVDRSELTGLQPFLDLCYAMGRRAVAVPDIQKFRHPRRQSIDRQREIVIAAADTLAPWPEGVHATLDRIFVEPPPEHQVRLAKVFPRMYLDLYRLPHLAVFRAAFEDYLVTRCPELLARAGGLKAIFRTREHPNRPVSLSQAAERLHVTKETLTRAAFEAGVSFHVGPRGIKRLYERDLGTLLPELSKQRMARIRYRWNGLSARSEGAQELTRQFKDQPFPSSGLRLSTSRESRLPLNFLARRSNVSDETLADMISCGFFRRFGSDDERRGVGLSAMVYIRFESALHEAIERDRPHLKGSGVPLLAALKHRLRRFGVTLSDLLQAVLDGNVRITDIESEANGLSRLKLDVGTVQKLADRGRRAWLGDRLTAVHAAKKGRGARLGAPGP